ncbi:MAG: hypothetical protein K6F15_04310 [Treponema sp.]|nr:hypothetical protein [Treponema sp.]
MKKTTIGLSVILFLTSIMYAQSVNIDYRFNLQEDDGKNYLNWSLDKEIYNDAYDAESGASLQKSTKALNKVRYDADKNLRVPSGFRGILLFPLNSFDKIESNGLKVSSQGKKVMITYLNHQYSILIESDSKGKIDIEKSFKKSEVGVRNPDKSVTFSPEFVKEGGDNTKACDLDLSNASYSHDKYSEKADGHYKGKLKAVYKNGILTLKGKLKFSPSNRG